VSRQGSREKQEELDEVFRKIQEWYDFDPRFEPFWSIYPIEDVKI
jgi:hypothetical protein